MYVTYSCVIVSTLQSLYPSESSPTPLWIGGWLGPRVDVDKNEKNVVNFDPNEFQSIGSHGLFPIMVRVVTAGTSRPSVTSRKEMTQVEINSE
jgi:hypothetical protein